MLEEVTGLLGWEVHHNEATPAILCQATTERGMAHLQNAVVVTYHQNLEIKRRGSTLYKLEILCPMHARFQGVLIRPHKDRSIGNRFTEGQLELDDIYLSALHGFEHGHIGVQRGIVHYDMRHQQQFFTLQALT